MKTCNTLLKTALILALAGSLTQAHADISAGLVAHWTLDATDIDGGQVLDISGEAEHHGTIIGSVHPAAGLIGGALWFAGRAGDADQVAFGNVLDPEDQSFSVSLWFKPENPDQRAFLMGKGNTTSGVTGWSIFYENRILIVRAYDGSASENRVGQHRPDTLTSEWHHVVLVIDREAQTMRGYFNGSNDGFMAGGGGAPTDVLQPETSFTSPAPLRLGVRGAADFEFRGLIDDVGIWRRALSPEEVQAIYLAGLDGRNLRGEDPILSFGNVTPESGAQFYAPADGLHLTIESRFGVAAEGIQLFLNEIDRTADLSVGGTAESRSVSFNDLLTSQFYTARIEVTDVEGNEGNLVIEFNTFSNGIIFVEAEDYNFEGGQYINEPELSSVPGPSNYLDRWGTQGIDYNAISTPGLDAYRIGDAIGTGFSGDFLRQHFVDAQAIDPGVEDYFVGWFADGEWLNYTRVFPADTYHVYARAAKSSGRFFAEFTEVTSGSTTFDQTVAPVGAFRGEATGGAQVYEFVPLTDVLGNPIALPVSGERTFRFHMVSGSSGFNLNYFMFAPAVDAPVQRPYIAAASPAPGAENLDGANVQFEIQIRNGDTTIDAGSIQLHVAGENVTAAASVSTSAEGAVILYTPAAELPVGRHAVAVSYEDSETEPVSYEWEIQAANLDVPGLWEFNEKPPGEMVGTEPDSVLDISGNERHGFASEPNLEYVPGSVEFGGGSAIRFTSEPGWIVVPDAAGSFRFMPDQSFTLEAIIRTVGIGQDSIGAIMAKQQAGGPEWWWRIESSGQHRFYMRDANPDRNLTGTTVLNDGNWHHVAVVYDAELHELRLYTDYAQDGDSLSTADAQWTGLIGSDTDLFIGAFQAGNRRFDGDMHATRISRGALTPEQFIQRSVALGPTVTATQPAADARFVAPDASLRVEITNRDTRVQLDSVQMQVNGVDVTEDISVSEVDNRVTVVYQAQQLPLGANTAVVEFEDNMTPAQTTVHEWTFTVSTDLPVLALWLFDEKAPGELVDPDVGAIRDSSGHGQHGTANDPLMEYVEGSPLHGGTSAIALRGGDHRVVVPDSEGHFNYAGSFTLEAVVRTTGTANNQAILSKNAAGQPEYWWRAPGAAPGVQRIGMNDATGGRFLAGNKVINDGQWYHLAGVYDRERQEIRLYVDYELDAIMLGAEFENPIGGNVDLHIGSFVGGGSTFNGDIDYIRISGDAIDPSSFLQQAEVGVVRPSISAVELENGSILLSFGTEAGSTYIVQATDVLGPQADWVDLVTISGDGEVKTHSVPAGGAQQYFRLKVE